MADSVRSMNKYLNLVEGKIKDPDDILANQIPDPTQLPAPRILAGLTKLETDLKTQ